MKQIISAVFFLMLGVCVKAQSHTIDSLKYALAKEKTDTGKIKILYSLSDAYDVYKPDTALFLAQKALLMARKIHYLSGESWALDHMADAFGRVGDYPQALEYYIEQLKIDETRNQPYSMAVVNMNIASLYHQQDDNNKALVYAAIADSIIKAHIADSLSNENNYLYLQMVSFLNTGDIYEKSNRLDSALTYSDKAYEIALRRRDTFMIGTSLNNLGNVYAKTGNTKEAFKYYYQGMPFLVASNNEDFICETSLGFARLYDETGRPDSAVYYGEKAYSLAGRFNFQARLLDASSFLTEHFKKANNIASAFNYLQVMTAVKDSINSRERIQKLQIISIDEQLRQKELAELRLQDNEDRKEKLQWLAIGILIPISFLISIFLSKRKVHKRVIEFSGIVSLLLLFEYLTLLLHPLVADTTNHSPVLEIIIFVCLAAIITPTHHRVQHWLTQKLARINYLKHHHVVVAPIATEQPGGENQENNSTPPVQ